MPIRYVSHDNQYAYWLIKHAQSLRQRVHGVLAISLQMPGAAISCDGSYWRAEKPSSLSERRRILSMAMAARQSAHAAVAASAAKGVPNISPVLGDEPFAAAAFVLIPSRCHGRTRHTFSVCGSRNVFDLLSPLPRTTRHFSARLPADLLLSGHSLYRIQLASYL